jgi:hypothetical protein
VSVTAVLVAMGVVGVSVFTPTAILVIAITCLVAAPIYVAIALRTEIHVAPGSVRVRTVLRTVDFDAGDTRVRVGRTQSGLTRTAPLLTLERIGDGRRVSVPLVSFPKAAQADLPEIVRAALSGR